jgi:nitrogen regulatory protein PII
MYKLIVALVKPEDTDEVVEAAREAGATGDVIIPGRGSGHKEAKAFFGLTIENQVEMLLFVVSEGCCERIINSINTVCNFEEPGKGLLFAIELEKVIGLQSQLKSNTSD